MEAEENKVTSIFKTFEYVKIFQKSIAMFACASVTIARTVSSVSSAERKFDIHGKSSEISPHRTYSPSPINEKLCRLLGFHGTSAVLNQSVVA
jgi:hypothetical protein